MPNSALRLHFVVAILVLILAFLPGCGIGDPIGHDRPVEGTYTLQRFNGLNVPGTLYEDASTKLEVLSGVLVLDADRRYREPIVVRRSNKRNGEVTAELQEDTGTYTVSGNTITFVSKDAGVGAYAGAWSVNTIAYTARGVTLMFLRQ